MLNQKIREVIEQFRTMLPADLSALIEQGAGEISALDIIERAKKTGDSVPFFELRNQHGELKTLSGYLNNGPLVVTFYRGVWCPYGNLQLKIYSDRIAEITAAGATLVAITPEKPNALEILTATGAPKDVIDMAVTDVPFDVLYDIDSKVAEEFGVIFELPESHKKLLKSLNVDIEKLTGSSKYTFPDPATYVIKPNGIISWAFVPNNYRRRAEVEDILQAVSQAE